MKISVQRSEVKEMVAGVSKVTGTHTTLPILAGVRFSSNGTVLAEATDLDQRARYTFSKATADGTGDFIVPLQAIKDLGKGNAQDQIEFETLPENRVNITNRIGSQSIGQIVVGFDPGEWPEGSADVKTQPAAGFLETYRKLVPFASVDAQRYMLNSVHIDVGGKGDSPVTMVATDGRRLTCWNSMALPIHLPTVIPVTKFLAWPGLTGEEAIGIATERENEKGKPKDRECVTQFGLSAGPWSFTIKTVDGTYPNWRQVLPNPQGCENRVTFTDEDIATLKKVLAGKGRRDPVISLTPGAGGTVVVAEQKPGDETNTRLELSGGSRFTGKVGIALNGAFLCDALDAGFKEFVYQDELCPLRSDDGHGGTTVVMPCRMGNEPRRDDAPVEPAPAENQPVEPVSAKTEAPVPEPAPEPKSEPAPDPDKSSGGGSEKASEEKNKKGTRPMTAKKDSAIEKLMAAFEAARDKQREANAAFAELAGLLKDACKEEKKTRSEIDDIRTALGKLQSIKV